MAMKFATEWTIIGLVQQISITQILASDRGRVKGLAIRWSQSKSITANPTSTSSNSSSSSSSIGHIQRFVLHQMYAALPQKVNIQYCYSASYMSLGRQRMKQHIEYRSQESMLK